MLFCEDANAYFPVSVLSVRENERCARVFEICRVLPKLTKIMQNVANKKPIYAHENTCFAQKNQSTYESVQSVGFPNPFNPTLPIELQS